MQLHVAPRSIASSPCDATRYDHGVSTDNQCSTGSLSGDAEPVEVPPQHGVTGLPLAPLVPANALLSNSSPEPEHFIRCCHC